MVFTPNSSCNAVVAYDLDFHPHMWCKLTWHHCKIVSLCTLRWNISSKWPDRTSKQSSINDCNRRFTSVGLAQACPSYLSLIHRRTGFNCVVKFVWRWIAYLIIALLRYYSIAVIQYCVHNFCEVKTVFAITIIRLSQLKLVLRCTRYTHQGQSPCRQWRLEII